MSCGQTNILRGEKGEEQTDMGLLIAIQGHGDTRSEVLLGFTSWSMALLQLWSVLMSVGPDTTEVLEDKALQLWPCPLMDSNTSENWSCPRHTLNTSGEKSQTSHLGSTVE